MQLSLPIDGDPVLPRIHARLLAVHGPQRDAQRLDPTTQFFKAMISGRTLDAVSDKAFARLTAFLRSWAALPDADPNAVAAVIRDVTYADDKARYLVEAARRIRAHQGCVDLAFLADWPVDAALSWLLHLPGVGMRGAATTLNFSVLRKPVLSIDIHVLRTSWRLGIVAHAADFDRAFHALMRLVPARWDADDLYELHWLMKLHGQMRCRHHRAICDGCPLAPMCAYRQSARKRRLERYSNRADSARMPKIRSNDSRPACVPDRNLTRLARSDPSPAARGK